MVQVFSPVSRHDPVRLGHRGRARDGATGRRAAALLGRRVVDERAVVDDRAEDALAEAVRHAHRIDERPDDVDLHREPERRRAIERAERHQHLGRLGHPRPEPAGRGRHDQPMQPRRDDRRRRPRLEGVAELERAQALERVRQREARSPSRRLPRPRHLLEWPPGARILDQRRQPALARRRLLGARDPVRRDAPIRRRSSFPVGPGRLVGLEAGELVVAERAGWPLIRIDRRCSRRSGPRRPPARPVASGPARSGSRPWRR